MFADMIPDVTVSIVSYNTRELLRRCLESLLARQKEGEVTLEIIVADNNSSDGSAAMVTNGFPSVQLINTGGNIGYGRANNLAFEKSQGRYFLVLNSDTEVELGALRAMRDFMDAQPQAGAVVAQLISPDGSIQGSCARDPSLLAVFWEQTYLAKIFPNSRIVGSYTMSYWDYNELREVEQAAGACLFVRREAYGQIDGFDPAYFMYFEDTDFCIRLRRAGWRIYFLPEARVRHYVGGSSQDWRTRARMIASYNQSRYYYFSRYFGVWHGYLLKAILLMGAGLRLVGWGLLLLIRPNIRSTARDQMRIFAHVLRRTWRMKKAGGPCA